MAVLTYSSRGVSCRCQDRKIWSTGEHVNAAPKLGFLAWKIDKKNYIAIPLMSDGKEGPPLDAARRCGLDQRIAHRLVPTVAVARSEQHGGALVDERLTSASLYGRFKGDLSTPWVRCPGGTPRALN